MATIRVEKTKNFTVMSNYHLQDKQLSLKAKGLLSFMLSLPDSWDYSTAGLVACLKEGRDCISSVLRELEEHGYLTRDRERNEKGQVIGTLFTVREIPITGNPSQEKAVYGKRGEPLKNKDSTPKDMRETPITGNPATGNPAQGNPIQINTNLTTTKEINTNIPQLLPQEEEDGWQTVIHLYENNIRPLTSSIEMEKLLSLYKDYGQMWCSAAITEAVENGAHNIKYITAILDRWKVDGFKADRRAKKTQAKKDAAAPENPNIRDGIDWSRFDG